MKKNEDRNALIEDLLGKMTRREKLGQLNQLGGSIYGRVDEAGFASMIAAGEVGSFLSAVGAKKLNELQRIAVEKSRLGIPVLFASDVIHGIKTIFPTPLAESCSFEPELAARTAAVAADEGSALGLRWTFAPMVDVARDCRWGRIIEGAGEDPYLGGLFAAARVRGFQGEGETVDSRHLAACVKHFAAYGAVEAGRDYNTVQLSDYNLYNAYLPPYYEGVKAGALTVMTAFNDINGIPCSANPALTRRLLRDVWGFGGVVVSDWQSIVETVAHRYAQDEADAAAEGLSAGVDMDMASELYIQFGERLLDEGRVPEALLDEMVMNVLRLKAAVGLFDDPYVDPSRETRLMTPEAYRVALESARKSIVLLENDGVLPLKPGSRVLVVGAMAADAVELHGAWASRDTADRTVSVLDGLKQVYDVTYIRGYDRKAIGEDFAEAERAAAGFDAVLAVAGESLFESGEAKSKTDVSLSAPQAEAIERLKKAGATVVVLLVNGRPMAIGRAARAANALVECWQLGTAGGEAVADVVSGKFAPEGRLTATFPRATGQCPIYYNRFSTGRPFDEKDEYTSKYLETPDRGYYNFGYGLSYTRFAYKNIRLDRDSGTPDDTLTVRLELTNVGKRPGTETVQLYYAPHHSKPVRPELQLGAFEKVRLAPGETRTVELSMPVERMGVYDQNWQRKVAPGKYAVAVGRASDALEQGSTYEVLEQ